MVLNSNFHSHCIFCDGRSHPEKFIRFALANNFRAYGFSSHSPLPFETFWNMTKSDMPEYIAEIQRLKVKYADQIEIYLGLEIDYLSENYNAALPYFRDLPLDYRISSIHFMPWQMPLLEDNMVCIDGSYEGFEDGVNEHYKGSIRALTEDFFRRSMNMVECGGFDIVGHIDKVYMNGSKHPDFNINADWFCKPFLELLDLIAEKGLTVEINTKNFTRKKETYPHVSSYKELKMRNIPVTVNSDCHYPDLVNDGRNETVALLREAGFRSTRELVKGQWQDLPLNPPPFPIN